MTALRPFLVLTAFALWWGGLTFYALVVVPVGTTVLDSAVAQGAVTQTVTVWLNRIGWLTLGAMVWDTTHGPTRGRWGILVLLVVIQFALLGVHARLDDLFQTQHREVLDPVAFRWWHITYLWLTTLQWLGGVAWLWRTLNAWAAVGVFALPSAAPAR
jgi:hypothetical protein